MADAVRNEPDGPVVAERSSMRFERLAGVRLELGSRLSAVGYAARAGDRFVFTDADGTSVTEVREVDGGFSLDVVTEPASANDGLVTGDIMRALVDDIRDLSEIGEKPGVEELAGVLRKHIDVSGRLRACAERDRS